MWRRFSWLLPLCTAAACTGLYLENGNAWPCDFSKAPGVRDEVCQAGDICGTNNRCQPFIYEGPRFEGPATVPEYGPASGEGAVQHPLVLKNALTEVTADLPLDRGLTGYARQGAGFLVVKSGHVGATTPTLPSQFPMGFGPPRTAQTFFSGPGPTPNVLVWGESNRLAVGTVGSASTDGVGTAGFGPFFATGFRVIDLPPSAMPQAIPVTWNLTQLGVVEKLDAGWEFVSWVANPGRVLDVAGVTVPGRIWVLVLQPDAIEMADPRDTRDAGVNDAGVSGAVVTLAASLEPLTVTSGVLKTDPGNRVVAAVRSGSLLPVGPRVDVLSTFQVNITSEGPTLSSPWPDCVPCPDGEHVELLAPSVRTGSPAVDVVCMGTGQLELGLPTPLRVVGSVALTQFDACLTEELDLPVPVDHLAGLPERIVHWNTQSGLLVGGANGELWSGETLTTLTPEFLDRVPLDVAPANAGRTPSLAVITDDYLAIQQTDENQLPGEQLNGFRRVPNRELGASEGAKLLSFVHGIGGWAVANGGELVRVKVLINAARVEAGAQLVTANEDEIRDSIGGEAFIKADGGSSFFVAADDSLYFIDNPELSLEPINDGQLQLPDLTPEPSVPIRSLALERTPLGTDEGRARGYLVTSRNVYSWQLGGNPARWSSALLGLTGGEPVEVWFDSPRSALGRVGYRDGQIFSLPGGYQLAEALPVGPDRVVPQVFDFENLGGWPVAYANTGLFIAGWDQVDGKLQNRFENGVNRPMTWREVKLANDVTPWTRRAPDGGVALLPRTKPGKLFVAVDPKDAAGQTLHRLLLFNDDEVRQVAHHLRK